MSKLLFAREPSREEKKVLKRILKEGENHLRKRARIILLSSEHKYKIPEISRIVDLHPINLRKWIHRFNRKGLGSILEAPRVGLKKRFDESFKIKLIGIVKQPPRKLGVFATHWTLHSLKDYLEKKGIVLGISHETIRRILKEANLSLKDLRKKGNLDPEY
ncbi:MAG: helix-turn-helix domain-containing protein [Caldiserica bacterium]|nr:helix-turn-helix domain-containing protein [Caldisericota bacterium]